MNNSLARAIALTFAAALSVNAAVRYKDAVFTSFNQVLNVKYGQAGTTALYLDYYEPAGDTVSKRAVVIWVHGGGFTGGDKGGDWQTFARNMTRFGYVSVSINYRLSSDYTGNTGQQDARAAVRWVRAKADSLRLDTSNIAIGGGSAGAIISMAVAYWEGPEGTSGNPGYSSAVHAVIDMWGWLHPVTEMEAGEPPIDIIHGTADETVPFAEGEAIHAQADAVGVPHVWRPLQGTGHSAYTYVISNLWWVTDFLYDYMIAGNTTPVTSGRAPAVMPRHGRAALTPKGATAPWQFDALGRAVTRRPHAPGVPALRVAQGTGDGTEALKAVSR